VLVIFFFVLSEASYKNEINSQAVMTPVQQT